jgi:hypothetical protein
VHEFSQYEINHLQAPWLFIIAQTAGTIVSSVVKMNQKVSILNQETIFG